jgi:hypothetical protein
MEWTEERPKVEGYYWVQYANESQITYVVKRGSNGHLWAKDNWIVCGPSFKLLDQWRDEYKWYGPLKLPEDEGRKPGIRMEELPPDDIRIILHYNEKMRDKILQSIATYTSFSQKELQDIYTICGSIDGMLKAIYHSDTERRDIFSILSEKTCSV